MKKLSPSDAIWENWTKRLDDAVGRRFDVVCKTELSILDDMRHISTFTAKDGSELDAHSCMMIRVFIEGWMSSLESGSQVIYQNDNPSLTSVPTKKSPKKTKA